MTRVACPECGYDLNLGKLNEGDQTTTTCDNCTSELLISIKNGEINTRNTTEYAYQNYAYSDYEEEMEF